MYVSRRQVGDVRFGFILVDLKVFTIIVGLLYFLLPLGMPLCEDLLLWPICVSCLHLLQRSWWWSLKNPSSAIPQSPGSYVIFAPASTKAELVLWEIEGQLDFGLFIHKVNVERSDNGKVLSRYSDTMSSTLPLCLVDLPAIPFQLLEYFGAPSISDLQKWEAAGCDWSCHLADTTCWSHALLLNIALIEQA